MDSALLHELRNHLAAATDLVGQLMAAQTCTDCGRTGRSLTPWREDGQVVAWLGPTCHRRRLDAPGRAQLPIAEGGTDA